MFFVLFFFFKQKTAYEMRISDWSSDVCSSDLKGDNRLINLREVTRQENSRNRPRRSDNTTGITGVSFSNGKWRARIKVDGQEIALGTFQIGRASCRERVCQYV